MRRGRKEGRKVNGEGRGEKRKKRKKYTGRENKKPNVVSLGSKQTRKENHASLDVFFSARKTPLIHSLRHRQTNRGNLGV